MKEIFIYFFKLGLSGFGGPLALTATMQSDLVEKRRWITPEEFQTSFSLIKSMPGPIAFSTAIYLAKRRAGYVGALIAGFNLVFPAFVMMIIFANLLFRQSDTNGVRAIISSVQIPALAVIVASLRPLARGFERNFLFWVFVFFSLILSFRFASWEPLIIIGLGLLSIAYERRPKMTAELGSLFFVCFKAGAFVFGSGLAIIPMLEADVVHRYGWLSSDDFLNAIALGQITPGPVVITATFIGYKVFGLLGATVATVAIFLANFIHMTTWFPSAVGYLSKQRWIFHFTRGALAAVVGSLIISVLRLGQTLSWSAISATVFILVIIVMDRKLLPAWAVIPLGGIICYFLEA